MLQGNMADTLMVPSTNLFVVVTHRAFAMQGHH
jgi:hypothetical protein